MKLPEESALRIAIGVRSFPNLVQTYILNQIATLKRAGVDVTIIAEHRGRYQAAELPDIFNAIRLLEDTIYIEPYGEKILTEVFSLPIGMRAYRRSILALLNSTIARTHGVKYLVKACIRVRAIALRPFDLLHSHSLFTSYNYLFLRELFSIPLVTTYHGMVPQGVPKLMDDRMERVFKKGDLFLVNTEFAKSELASLGCPVHKIQILPQGTELGAFPFRERHIDPAQNIILLTVGRLSVEKGHRIAIEAIAHLADEFPALEYHIIGEGPEETALSALVKNLGLERRVKLFGKKAGKEFYEAYAAAHIFVLPSIDTGDGFHVETQGVVLQEAQAAGIPVIASRTGGIPEIVQDGVTGLLFKERDSLELAERIRQLTRDAASYRRLALDGRKDVEQRFSMSVIGKKLLSTYRGLIGPVNSEARAAGQGVLR